jgi:hypothetical protein
MAMIKQFCKVLAFMLIMPLAHANTGVMSLRVGILGLTGGLSFPDMAYVQKFMPGTERTESFSYEATGDFTDQSLQLSFSAIETITVSGAGKTGIPLKDISTGTTTGLVLTSIQLMCNGGQGGGPVMFSGASGGGCSLAGNSSTIMFNGSGTSCTVAFANATASCLEGGGTVGLSAATADAAAANAYAASITATVVNNP